VEEWSSNKKVTVILKIKNTVFAKSAILANFYFAPGGFQCTANGIFIPKNLKLGKISTKKAL